MCKNSRAVICEHILVYCRCRCHFGVGSGRQVMMHHKTKNQQEYVVDRNLLQVAVPPNHDGCHARTPYASLMATLLCFIGVVMFTVMMIRSFNGCIEQFRRSTNIDRLPGLDKARIVFYVIVTIMCLAALFLLLVGFLSTGSTREELYGTAHTRRGGRVVCAIAMVLSYLLTIMWIAIITFTSILIFAYAIFSNLCLSLDGYSETNCLDFRVFHPLFKDVVKNDLNFCGGNVQQFCAFSTTLITYVVVAHIGGFIVVLGLLHFLACHAANYAHVNNNKRYLELRGVIYAEDGYETSNTPVGRPAVEPQFSAASVVRVQETFRKPSPAKMPVQRFHAPPNKTMTDDNGYNSHYHSFSRKRPY